MRCLFSSGNGGMIIIINPVMKFLFPFNHSISSCIIHIHISNMIINNTHLYICSVFLLLFLMAIYVIFINNELAHDNNNNNTNNIIHYYELVESKLSKCQLIQSEMLMFRVCVCGCHIFWIIMFSLHFIL